MIGRAITGVAPEGDLDRALVQGQAGPLELRRRERPGRVHDLVEEDSPCSECQPHHVMGDHRPVHFVSHHEHLGERRVDHGVEVIPTFGEMSPQGSDDAGTGVPTVVDHATVPFDALSP